MRPAPVRLLPFFSIASLIGIVAAALWVTLWYVAQPLPTWSP